ncbi:MAG: pyrrolo-quinoline quinone [Alphaproteobacteria bacterium]|nr:pyrrolo-quinoline quinone [Alphaproteobacteria bacterium]
MTLRRRAVGRAIGTLVIALALGACEGLTPDWLGTPEPPPLEGDRISIMLLDRSLDVDASLAEVPVRLPPPLPTPNWPQSGGVADHAMHHVAAPGPLARAWRADAGAGSSSDTRILSEPVVARGVVYALDAEGTVSAIAADDGRRLWRFDTTPEDDDDGGVGGGVAFGQGRLFVTTGFGEVLALDGRDGALLWRRRVGPPLRAAPSYSQGRVYAVTTDNQLLALASDTGEILWQHRGIEETAGLLGGASPAVVPDVVVVAYSSGEIYALRVENGSVAWTDSLSYANAAQSLGAINDINGNPVIDRGRVFASSYGGRLAALDLRAGVVVWDVEMSSVQTPWVAGDFLYVVDDEDVLYCLSWQEGRVRWLTELPRWDDPDDHSDPIAWTGPILAGDRLLLAGTNGHVLAVSPYTGAILGRIDLGEGIDVAPIAADGTVYLLTQAADLYALR